MKSLAPPFPPRIVPLLVRVPIAPEFTMPAPPAPPEKPDPPFPPPIVARPALLRDAIVRPEAFNTPAPPAPPILTSTPPPAPPLIVPLLVSVLTVPEFDIARAARAAGEGWSRLFRRGSFRCWSAS